MFSDSLSSSSSDESSETSSDDSSDSGTRQKPSKSVTSSNKSSTFLAKRKSDNEETTSSGRLHFETRNFRNNQVFTYINCGFLDTEHLFMLPINCLNHRNVPDVNVEIVQEFYNAYSTPKSFLVERDYDSWDPEIHGPRIYLQSYHVNALIDKFSTKKHYPLAMFRNGISKKTRSSVTGKMDDRIPS